MDANQPASSGDSSQVICIHSFNDRLTAELAAGMLEANGIKACISTDDCAGLMPVLNTGAVRLWVFDKNSGDATTLLGLTQPQQTDTIRKLFKPTKLPHDRPKVIVVIGIWLIFGLALTGQIYFLSQVWLLLHDGIGKLFVCFLGLIQPVVSVYMLFGSVRNYSIQKARASARDKKQT